MAVAIPRARFSNDNHTLGEKVVYGGVEIDVILEQMHQSTLSITRNPVEFGADVTDHAYVEPKRLSMHIITSQGIERAFATYNNLIALQETRIPFDLVTGLKQYKNLLIEGITVTRSHITGQILDANIDLLEIIFSTGMEPTSFRPVSNGPGDRRFGPRRGTGRQQTEPEEVSPSILDQALFPDSGGGGGDR